MAPLMLLPQPRTVAVLSLLLGCGAITAASSTFLVGPPLGLCFLAAVASFVIGWMLPRGRATSRGEERRYTRERRWTLWLSIVIAILLPSLSDMVIVWIAWLALGVLAGILGRQFLETRCRR